MHLATRARSSVAVGLLGLIFFTVVCGIVAIVLGMKARGEINDDTQVYGGGMAIAGICLGSIDLLFFAINIMTRH